MTRDISVYQSTPNAVELINAMGAAIKKSGLLGCENEPQGQVLAMTCLAKGCDPLSLAQRYHIIQGNLSMRADAMLAEFRAGGGRHKIVQRDADAAEISLTMDGNTETFRFTWEEASAEPFTKNRKGQIKENYATPRARMQMLWARVVSDGVRAMAPEVNNGSYTPEEISDFDSDRSPRGRADRPAEVASAPSPPASVPPEESAEDAQFEPKVAAGPPKATGDQVKRITELFGALSMPGDKQLASIKKRGATDMSDLSQEGADDLLLALEKRAGQQADQVAGESKANGQATGEPVDGPCDEQQIAQMTSLMKQIAQAPGHAETTNKIRAHLQKCGLQRLRDLSHGEANKFIHALTTKNVEAFFEMSLSGAAPKNQ